MTRILTLLITLFICLSGNAEGFWKQTHYDDHNGMSQWHLTKILQDQRGFMWFATWNGLNRYDGYDFAVFKSHPGDGCDLTSDRIRNMVIGDDGNIYFLINNHVWRFNLTTYLIEDIDANTQERYRARMDSDASLFKDQRDITVEGIGIEKARQLFTDIQKNHWVMGQYGVEKITPAPQPAFFLSTVPNDIIRSMFRDNKKRIWITGRNTGVVTVLDSTANLIGYLGKDGSLHREQCSFASIFCVTQQRNGTIWMGSKPDGLFRLRETSNGKFDIDHFMPGSKGDIMAGKTLSCSIVYNIAEDKQGRLWVATQGDGLNLITNPNAEQLHFLNRENTFKSYPKANNMMRRVMAVGDDLLLATTTEGLLVVKGLKGDPRKMSFTVHAREANRKESISSSATMDMLIDRKGRLFVSTESGGVNMLLTKDLAAKQFDFKHYDVPSGMGSDVALAMTEVGDEILVQCNNQVTRLNADTDEKENFNELFFTFSSRFSDAEPVLLRDGRWLLSLETGVIIVPEQSFHQRSYVPNIVLTSAKIPGREPIYNIDSSDTLVLESNERDVAITYAALDYSDNSHIKYSTRFLKTDDWFASSDSTQWTLPSEIRQTDLYNLSPGTYTLEIRSTNAEGLWVKNTRTLTIIVTPMFWETTLAYIIYIILAILVISGITYTVVYIRNLDRQREENLQAYLRLMEARKSSVKEKESANAAPASSDTTPEKTADQAPQTTEEPQQEPAPEPQVISHLSEEDDAFMRRLINFVDENLGDSSIGVDEMASATATSRSSLNRKTKSLLGVTPADFLKEARMKRACQMLTSSMRSVNDIAYSCGFSDPKYFSKCFKASIGTSPSDYRQSQQNGQTV